MSSPTSSDRLINTAKQCVIRLKDGKLSRLGDVLSPEQEVILEALAEHPRVVIPKARQLGVSTICRIYQVLYALGHKGSNCAVLSNKYSGTQEISRIDDLVLDYLGKQIGRDLVVSRNTRETVLSNGSRILRFSGSASNDRGYTLDHLHISEFAYLPDGSDILATLLASISPSRGQVVIESTPYYYGDPLHKIVTYTQGEGEEKVWYCLFQPWYSFSGYVAPADSITTLMPEEIQLTNMGISLEQLAWRRRRIAELAGDVPKFKREYPSTLQEAYDVSDEAYLDPAMVALLQPARYTATTNGSITIARYGDVNTRTQYCIGYDPSGGTGGDYACAIVMDRISRNVVAVAWSNTATIKDMTVAVCNLSAQYNKATVMVELNNHGHAVKEIWDNLHFANYRTYTTTVKSKIALYDTLRNAIYNGTVGVLDTKTIEELRSLVRSDRGLAPSASSGAHDDRCMALALCTYLDASLSTPTPNNLPIPTPTKTAPMLPRRLK